MIRPRVLKDCLPCPFCGGTPFLHCDESQIDGLYEVYIVCGACGATPGNLKTTMEQEGTCFTDKIVQHHKNYWNRRTGGK